MRRVNAAQAAVVRRIFELYASGLGLTRIAKSLNADRMAPPRRDGNGWAPTAIRAMLYRPLYRGEVVWNRSQKIDRGGTKKQRKRPPEDWVHVDAPELQIVPEDVWQTVHTRLARNQAAFPRSQEGGRLLGRPTNSDVASPYLLSGLGRCGVCGGTFIAMTRNHGKRRANFYGCGYNYKRGATICSNSAQIRQDVLDQAVLNVITEVLDERIMERAVDEALVRLRAGQEQHLDRKTRIERELSLIEAQERRLIEAIKRGEAVEPLVAALKGEEERKAALTKELASLGELAQVISLDAERLKRDVKARAVDVKGLLSRQTPQARQMLRKLLVDRLRFGALRRVRATGIPLHRAGQLRPSPFRRSGATDGGGSISESAAQSSAILVDLSPRTLP